MKPSSQPLVLGLLAVLSLGACRQHSEDPDSSSRPSSQERKGHLNSKKSSAILQGNAGSIEAKIRKRIAEGPASRNQLISALEDLEKVDPDAALRLLSEIGDGPIVANSLRRLVSRVSVESLPALFDLASRAVDPANASAVHHSVLGRLAHEDAEAGWRVVDPLPAGSERVNLVQTFVANLAPQDVSAFFERIASLPYAEDRNAAASALTSVIAQMPSGEIAKLLETSAGSSLVDSIAAGYGRAWAQEGADYSQLVASLRNLPAARDTALSTWAGYRSRENPEEFAAQMKGMGLSTEDKSKLYPIIAGNYAVDDPQAATQWIFDEVKGGENASAVMASMGQWVRKNSQEASQWLGDQPPSLARDYGAAEIVRYLSRKKDFSGAQAWLESIGDQALKEQAHGYLGQD